MIDIKELRYKLINMYGEQNQYFKCVEEMSELTKEILKNIQGKDNTTLIKEELMDVIITINILKTILNVSDEEILNTEVFKINRALGGRK